jgi:glyoxylase-like metal-dependent hydrolase (beta-lactamase superfamily II)
VVGAGEEAFVVDPSLETDRYMDEAARRGWRITRVYDTHLHADHISGARALAGATGASLHLNPADAFEFAFVPLADGHYFELGGQVHFGVSVFSTPGHTRGSTVFEIGGRAILTGDTLFIDGVGRPDLAERAEEFAHDLYRSLHTKVLSLTPRLSSSPPTTETPSTFTPASQWPRRSGTSAVRLLSSIGTRTPSSPGPPRERPHAHPTTRRSSA